MDTPTTIDATLDLLDDLDVVTAAERTAEMTGEALEILETGSRRVVRRLGRQARRHPRVLFGVAVLAAVVVALVMARRQRDREVDVVDDSPAMRRAA